jgi:DNA-binding response OmpR family regulator
MRQASEDNMQIGVEVSRAVENKRIFVVVGDEIIRSALQFMLHDENETHELASVEQSFEKGVEWKPDLVILGLDIVGENGPGVLAEVAQKFAGVKILLFADKTGDPLAQSCLSSGAHDVLSKPLTIEAVRHKVDILLGRKKLPMASLGMLQPIVRA